MGDERFKKLPEPVRFEDTIASEDSAEHIEPVVVLEDNWLLRNAGA